MDDLLLVPESGVISGFEKLKADPGKPVVDNLQGEIGKLKLFAPSASGRTICRSSLEGAANVQTACYQRKGQRDARAPEGVRYALMGCFLHVRLEVTET